MLPTAQTCTENYLTFGCPQSIVWTYTFLSFILYPTAFIFFITGIILFTIWLFDKTKKPYFVLGLVFLSFLPLVIIGTLLVGLIDSNFSSTW